MTSAARAEGLGTGSLSVRMPGQAVGAVPEQMSAAGYLVSAGRPFDPARVIAWTACASRS
jgi:hypothetical protein